MPLLGCATRCVTRPHTGPAIPPALTRAVLRPNLASISLGECSSGDLSDYAPYYCSPALLGAIAPWLTGKTAPELQLFCIDMTMLRSMPWPSPSQALSRVVHLVITEADSALLGELPNLCRARVGQLTYTGPLWWVPGCLHARHRGVQWFDGLMSMRCVPGGLCAHQSA
jgi:hypothetical protein